MTRRAFFAFQHIGKASGSRKPLFLYFRDRGSMGRGVRFFDLGDFLRFLLLIVPEYGTGMG